MQWFYNTKAWKKTRKLYIAEHPICESCKIELAKEIHHIIHLTPENVKDSDIAFGFNNLKALCRECHNKEHNRFIKATAACADNVAFDKNGNIKFKKENEND